MTDAVLMFGYSKKTQSEIERLDKSDRERYLGYDLRRYFVEFDGEPIYSKLLQAVKGSQSIERIALVGDRELESLIDDDIIFQEMGTSKLDNALRGWEALGRPEQTLAYIPCDSPTLTANDIDEMVALIGKGDFVYPLISMHHNKVWRNGKKRYIHFKIDTHLEQSEADQFDGYSKELNCLGINFSNLHAEGLDYLVENTKIRSLRGLFSSIYAFCKYSKDRLRDENGSINAGRAYSVAHSFASALGSIGQSIVSKRVPFLPTPNINRVKVALSYFIGTEPENIRTPFSSNVNLAMDMDTAEDAFVIMYVLAKRKNPNDQINRWEDIKERITYKGDLLLKTIGVTGEKQKKWFDRLYQERGNPTDYDRLV